MKYTTSKNKKPPIGQHISHSNRLGNLSTGYFIYFQLRCICAHSAHLHRLYTYINIKFNRETLTRAAISVCAEKRFLSFRQRQQTLYIYDTGARATPLMRGCSAAGAHTAKRIAGFPAIASRRSAKIDNSTSHAAVKERLSSYVCGSARGSRLRLKSLGQHTVGSLSLGAAPLSATRRPETRTTENAFIGPRFTQGMGEWVIELGFSASAGSGHAWVALWLRKKNTRERDPHTLRSEGRKEVVITIHENE